MDAYALVLDEAAAKMLVAAARSEQRKLGVILDRLKTAPFHRGDFQQRDAAGRMHEVALIDEWLVTFWSDHAARELRVVNLERADD